MTDSLNTALETLGETMASNLVTKGVTGASASDGLTTLAGKILQVPSGGSKYSYEDDCSTDKTSDYTKTSATLTYDSTNNCYNIQNSSNNSFGYAQLTNKTFSKDIKISADIQLKGVSGVDCNHQFAFRFNNLVTRVILNRGGAGNWGARQITLSNTSYSDTATANVTSAVYDTWYRLELTINNGNAILCLKNGDTSLGTCTGNINSLLTTDNSFYLYEGYSPVNNQASIKNIKIIEL